jgi:molybdopterin synthase catalytic subunit
MKRFSVTECVLDVKEVVTQVASPECGGIDLFLGVVRDHEQGRPVTLLEYHAYVSMAEKQLERIARGIEAEVPGVRLAAAHRIGALQVGEAAVICAAAAPHRHEAFVACRLLIDRIKHDVPIWKREHGPDGPYWVGWQDARCSGHHGTRPAAEYAAGDHTAAEKVPTEL